VLDPVKVKGKRAPAQAYRVIRQKAQLGPLRGIEGLHAPLVGRQAELEKLKEAFSNLNQGRGGILFLTGEAGIGKSRLIEELKAVWQVKSDLGLLPIWSEVRSIPYDASLPYGLFQQWFKQT
jgi:MoxR-like ATPase